MTRRDEPFDEPTPRRELTNYPEDEQRLHEARARQATRERDADMREQLRGER